MDGDVHNHHALGAQVEGEHLEGVGDEQAREANVVKDAKQPDEAKLDVAPHHVGLVRVFEHGAADGPAGHRDDHAARRHEKQRATSESVDVEGGRDGDNQVEGDLAGRHGQLLALLLVLDAGASVDDVHVVGKDGVAAVLRNDTERHDDGQAPAVPAGAEEVDKLGSPVNLLLDADRLLDLAELELHRRVVDVAAGVPLGERAQGFFVAVLVDEEARRLGQKPDAAELDKGGDDLEEGDGPPRVITVDVDGAKRQACYQQSAGVPQAVVDGRDGAAVLRVADLGEEEGRCHL